MFIPKKYKVDINRIISNDLNNQNLEIELRFRGNLNKENINSLIEYFNENDYIKNESFSIDYIGVTEDYKTPIRISKEKSKYYETTKSNVLTNFIDKNNYNLKLSVNKEIRKEIKEKPNIFNELIREKKRTTYSKNNLQVDLTEVIENKKSKTELEIEVINPYNFNFEDFNNLAQKIYEILSISYDSITQIFTAALGRESENLMSIYAFISRPRDLEIADLTNDGILKPFAISLKADGVQKFMLFHISGVYFIDLNEVNKISSKKYEKTSLYVGEYINDKNLYLPFDTIVFEDENVKDNNYLFRYKFCQKINNLKINDKINILEKPIYTYENNVKSFNETITQVYLSDEQSEFNIDGLIFTPIQSGYLANGQNKDSKNRILSKYNDVCKYKKPEDLTIDFLVKDNALYSYDQNKLKKPWFMNENNIAKETFLVNKYKNKIVEFKPILDDENNTIIYKPIRIREDKNYPNKLEVAEKLYKLRQNPIEKETLEGKTTQLMRRYHNVIKRTIIRNQSGFVIDIGSGRGGDLDKYNKNTNIKKVFSIEPNKEFIDEYNQRLNALKYGKEKFYNVQGGGEDTEKIITGSSKFFKEITVKDNININFMISLSFFWKDITTLKKLANTINLIREYYKNNKVFINFLTIEGEELEKLFEQKQKDKIILNTVTLIRKANNKIFVDIKDGKTVHNQEEYLVKLNQLWQLTKFYPTLMDQATGTKKTDYILSENEKIYSSLFFYGTAIYNPKFFDFKSSLLVDEKKGVKTDNGVMAYGDDDSEDFFHKLKRKAVLKKYGSLNHSLLKLLSEKYRNADVYNRIKMAKDLSLKLDSDLNNVAKKIKHGIVVYEGPYKTTKYNEDADKWLLLHRSIDNEFEPLYFDDGDNEHYIFDKDSDLIN